MDRVITEPNFKVKDQVLPPLKVQQIRDPNMSQQLMNNLTQPDRTSVSWMDQNSSIMNQTYLLNRSLNNTSFNFYANKTLKSIDGNSFQTPNKVMKKLRDKYSSQIWQTQSSGFFNIQSTKTNEEVRDEQMESKFLNKLNESYEEKPHDQDQKECIGERSEQTYYSHYKKLNRVKQQNLFYSDVTDSAFTSMLRESETKRVTPCKLGLIKEQGSDDQLVIDNRKIGDEYACMLSEGLKKTPHIKKFHLKNNRLSQKGSQKLIDQIAKSAKILDLSYNTIGRSGCQKLANCLIPKAGNIQYLNLEGNKLGDNSANILLDNMQYNKTMTYLNLSQNFLSDGIKDNLQKILLDHPSLQELYLRWNNLKAGSGIIIFQSLTENKNGPLKVLDVSCNNLSQQGNCEEEIAEFFQSNEEIVHIDLSNNKFSYQQSQVLAKGLECNHTIYGIHFQGNHGYIDSRGFLIVEKEYKNIESNCELTKNKIDGCKVVINRMFRHHRDLDLRDCCWICQGWTENQFTWTKGVSGDGDTDPLFIHFNFEDYRPCYHGKNQGDVLEYTRMVPPGELDYFYTTGTGEEQSHAKDQPNTKVLFHSIFNDILMPDGEIKTVELERYNQQVVQKSTILNQYEPVIRTKPRTKDPVYIPEKKKKTKKRWTFPISLMYKWKPDHDDVINKCFEFDWDHSRIFKVIKDQGELEKSKQFFRERYRYFKNTYKHFACINPVGDVWAIQTPAFFEIVNHVNLIDNKLIKDADMNIKWTSVISGGDKGNPRNPIQAVNRHQFMEVWVRVAEEKYILKYKTTNSHFEAVKNLWEEHLETLFTTFNQQNWRQDRYWNEDCDYCLKHYLKIIDQVYKLHSKKKVKPGQVPFMCLDELLQIINMCNLQQEESFGSSVYLVAFNESMMTQVDEIGNDRIFQMSHVEFYEALARIAEEASLIPMCGEYGIHQDEDNWTLKRRKEQPLGHKIEALVLRLYDCCLDAAYKLNHPRPTRSFFWVDPDESDFDYVD